MAIALNEFKYSSLALFLLAGTLTLLRLIFFRFVRQRHWWLDDFFAFLGLLCLATFVPFAFVMSEGPHIPRHLRIAAFYMVGGLFYSTIWCARLSIVFTVIRIAPSPSQTRALSGVAVFFFLQWALLITQMFWVCEKRDPSWKNRPYAQCVLGDAVGITQVATETISDFILVVAPLWILRGLRVSSGLRMRLIAIFSCSIITTVAGVIHAVMVLKMPGALEAIMGAVENCVALSVCNIPVVVPALAARERERSEESWTGFGKQTTFLSTINTLHMHIDPEESRQVPSKDPRHQDSVGCGCSDASVVASSNSKIVEYPAACHFSRGGPPL